LLGDVSMAISNTEALLKEILEDLKKQGDLKKEILTELKPVSRRQRFLEWSKHPVLLLVLGSVLGGWLTSCYQRREWTRQHLVLTEQQEYERKQQQEELKRKQKTELMIAIRDEALESIINAHSAAQSAVRPLLYEDARTYMGNESWEIAKFKVTQKIEMAFSADAQQKFKDISEAKTPKDNYIFIDVNNILAAARKTPGMLNETRKIIKQQSKQYRDYKDAIRQNVLAPVVKVKEKTKELMALLQKEIDDAI
jgi:hypothetical protein